MIQQRRATKHILMHDHMLQCAVALWLLRGVGVARQARSAFRVARCGPPRVVGSQAFNNANAFNVNIGAWNTASIKDMSSVCALRPSTYIHRYHMFMYAHAHTHTQTHIHIHIRMCVGVC